MRGNDAGNALVVVFDKTCPTSVKSIRFRGSGTEKEDGVFNIDEKQSRLLRMTLGAAFAFWLASQIADASFFERFWNQLALLTLGAGALRVWILEGAKIEAS